MRLRVFSGIMLGRLFQINYGIIGLLVFQFAMVQQGRAQNWPSELWHDGKIVLTNGDTLRGLIKYDLQQDLVQYTLEDKRTEAFSARKIMFFEIFDETVRQYRQFFALPYTTTTGYRAPIFFELLADGKLTLLSRESLEYRTYNSPYYLGGYSRQMLVYKFYFLDEKGSIVEFSGNKTDLLNLMGRKSDDVEKYIKEHKLKVDDKYDFARIVAYYNSI
jgi:hypothetical protein